MIKFFRKIRKNMIKENKVSKYMLYAIGEIVLVVIGILIALSINNTNENNKKRNFEIRILKNIQEDIIADKVDLNFNLKYHKIYFINQQRLLDFLFSDNLKPKDDSIIYTEALGLDLVTAIHRGSYNNLQNNDIGLITNNKLYKKITRFYDFFATSIIEIENNVANVNPYNDKLIYFKKHFKLVNNKTQLIAEVNSTDVDYYDQTVIERYQFEIKNVTDLKNDEAFKISLAESLFTTSYKVEFYSQILERIDKLDANIQNELKILQSK